MRKVLIVVAVVLAAVLPAGAGGGLYVYDATRDDVLARGITIAGIDVGGLRADEARVMLRARLLPGLALPVTAVHGERAFRLHPRDAEVRTHVDAMVDAALDRSRAGTFLERATRYLTRAELKTRIPLRVTYSRAAVSRLVEQIEHAVERSPRNASARPSLTSIAVIPSRDGVAVRTRALARAFAARLTSATAERVFGVPTAVRKPKVTTEELRRTFATYIAVSREEKRLRLFRGLKLAKIYTIAVGQIAYETPAGLYRVQSKAVDPAWYVPNRPWAGELDGKVIPPGPENPIKARWMGFYDGAGIHGTDAVSSLGTAASHGCVRMSIPDVIELYEIVPLGTPIYIA